jgi:hypothetical protein
MKTQMMEIVDGTMFVFGSPISRHPERPWLFSITDVYKSCEKAIKKQAEKAGKNPDSVYTHRRPVEWMRSYASPERIQFSAKKVRIRINKYGPTCGMQLEWESPTSLAIKKLTERQVLTKNIGIGLSIATIEDDTRETIPNKEGRHIGVYSGIKARMILEDADTKAYLNSRIEAEMKLIIGTK